MLKSRFRIAGEVLVIATLAGSAAVQSPRAPINTLNDLEAELLDCWVPPTNSPRSISTSSPRRRIPTLGASMKSWRRSSIAQIPTNRWSIAPPSLSRPRNQLRSRTCRPMT